MPSTTLPLLVTETPRGTHVVHVRRFSKLRKRQCGGYVPSPTFTAGGLDWLVRYHPDGAGDDDAERGHVGAFLELVTPGAAAWAHVTFGLVDRATGHVDTVFWHDDTALFDAGNAVCCAMGSGKLASRRGRIRRSRYLRRDCLQIECAVEVCRDRIAFFHDDPPPPPPNKLLAPTMQVDPAAAPLGDDTDMPAAAVEALRQFIDTGTLPVVAGMSGDGYVDVLRHLLLAGERHGLRRLKAICEPVLCDCLDVERAVAMLSEPKYYGFEKLREACVDFVSEPKYYELVQERLCRVAPDLALDVWAQYCVKRGVPYDERERL